MMPYGELSVNAHALFGSYALLLTTAAIYLLVNTFALHFSLQSRAFSVCLALGCVFVLMGMGDTLIDAPAMSKTAGCIVRLSAVELALVLLMLTVLAVIFYIRSRARLCGRGRAWTPCRTVCAFTAKTVRLCLLMCK